MSFSLTVLAPAFPDEIVRTWLSALSRHGLDAEVYPGFAPSTWSGGFLPFRVTVQAGAFPTAARYGTEPLLGGFEISFAETDAAEMEELAAEEHGATAAALRTTRVEATLSTSMGRSVLDLRLQSFAAATLAIVVNGVVLDAQQGKYFRGDEAVTNAARESDGFDAQPINPRDWDITPFPGWEALGPAE